MISGEEQERKKYPPRIQSLPYKVAESEVEQQQEFLLKSNRNSAEDPDHQPTETLALKAVFISHSAGDTYPTVQLSQKLLQENDSGTDTAYT